MAARNSVLFNSDLKEPRESTQCRSGLSEFYMVGTDIEKFLDEKLEATAGFNNR